MQALTEMDVEKNTYLDGAKGTLKIWKDGTAIQLQDGYLAEYVSCGLLAE